MKDLKCCVYFFRHVGLSPIKIGYSKNESPYRRFEQFKTYAPFGAELIGFIRTIRSKELEVELHQKYSRDRIKGEWFEITKEEVEKCIKFYSSLEDIEEMNNFQVAWARGLVREYIDESKNNIKNVRDKIIEKFSFIGDKKDACHLNQTEISEMISEDKRTISIVLKEENVPLKSYRTSKGNKKAYRLYKIN